MGELAGLGERAQWGLVRIRPGSRGLSDHARDPPVGPDRVHYAWGRERGGRASRRERGGRMRCVGVRGVCVGAGSVWGCGVCVWGACMLGA